MAASHMGTTPVPKRPTFRQTCCSFLSRCRALSLWIYFAHSHWLPADKKPDTHVENVRDTLCHLVHNLANYLRTPRLVAREVCAVVICRCFSRRIMIYYLLQIRVRRRCTLLLCATLLRTAIEVDMWGLQHGARHRTGLTPRRCISHG